VSLKEEFVTKKPEAFDKEGAAAACCERVKYVMVSHNLLLVFHRLALVLVLDLVEVGGLSSVTSILIVVSSCHSSQPWDCHAVSFIPILRLVFLPFILSQKESISRKLFPVLFPFLFPWFEI